MIKHGTVNGKKWQYAAMLRNRMTPAERRLWSRLRYNQLGVSFKPQFVLRGWIVDFWCSRHLLAIEVDGGIHEDPEVAEKDRVKEQSLCKAGYTVLRFKNEEVYDDLDGVVGAILEVMKGTALQ